MASIPSVDLSPFFVEEGMVIGEEPTPAQLDCAAQIDQICRQHGFLYATGLPVTRKLVKQAFEASQQLFNLPVETKVNELNEWEPSKDTGYSKYQRESTNIRRPAELKEAYSVRFPPKHKNDFCGTPPAFANVAEELLKVLERAAHGHARACALALKLPLDFFDRNLSKMDLCTLRFLHYPPCDFEETGIGIDKPLRIGEHCDFGAFTFLFLGQGAAGLQIKPVEGGEAGGEAGGEDTGWIDVVIPEGTVGDSAPCIINTGTLMAHWTNDTWRATAHRVIVPTLEEANRHRYSIAFFVDPDADSVVKVHDQFVAPDEPCKYEETTGLGYLLMKLNELANPTVVVGSGAE